MFLENIDPTLLIIAGALLIALIIGLVSWKKTQEGHIKTDVTHLQK